MNPEPWALALNATETSRDRRRRRRWGSLVVTSRTLTSRTPPQGWRCQTHSGKHTRVQGYESTVQGLGF